jgi:hypothetical protein
MAFIKKLVQALILLSFFGSVRTIYQLIFLLKLRLQIEIKAQACIIEHTFVFASALVLASVRS